jgi:hypothetical protein
MGYNKLETQEILRRSYDDTAKAIRTQVEGISIDNLDVNTNSVDTSGLIGKSAGNKADFTVAYASGTTLTIGTYPDGSTLIVTDIESIRVLSTAGAVIQELTRDELTLSMSGSTLTVTGFTSAFNSTDNFIIYTNVPRSPSYDSGLDVTKTVVQGYIPKNYVDYVTVVTAQDLTDTNANFGGSIDCRGYSKVGLYIITDVNSSETVTLDGYAQVESGASELYTIDGVSTKTLWTTGASDEYLYCEFNVGAISFLQLQAKAETVGATAGDLTIAITKVE